jgi:plasmid maintenance system antidote protein VapI
MYLAKNIVKKEFVMHGRDLKAYLATIGMKQTEFAKLMHIGPGYVSEIISEKRTPGKRLSIDISKFTGGKVNLPWNERKNPEKRLERKAEGE